MNGELINEKPGENHVHSSKRSKCIAVSLLDDTEYNVVIEPKSKGEEVIKKVNTHLNLEEPAFFGVLFVAPDETHYWLDPKKSIFKQIKDPIGTKFKFRVMYYTPDPNSLSEYTRYLFTLQIRRDLLDGRLLCPEDTGALLASYIVQGELGNYDPVSHPDGYLKGFNFVPNQTVEIEEKIVDYHKSHRGVGPAESDHQMLDIACKLDMYGITVYPAHDCNGNEVGLAIYHMGVTVFKNEQRTHSYLWENLRKISFKKKRVLLKLRPQPDKSGLNVVVFSLNNRNAAKNFWKICVNHHVFFRAHTAQPVKKNTFFRQGSKYVYNGKTKKEIEVAEKPRRTPEHENDTSQQYPISSDPSELSPISSTDQQKVDSNGNSRLQSEDCGSYSIQSEWSSHVQENDELAEDNYIPITNIIHQPCKPNKMTIETMEHQENGVSEVIHNGYTNTQNDSPFPEKPFNEISFLEYLKMTDGEDEMLGAADVTNTDKTEDETNFSGSTPFSLEVESMFKNINSGYSGTQSGWQYHMTSVTLSEHEDDAKDEGSETEDNTCHLSEFTEVDANQVMVDFNENQYKCSDKTEADEETEMQLKQKVIDLYVPQQNTVPAYDSDSDATPNTVDEEESAFDDSTSLPSHSSSSVSSIHMRESYLHKSHRFKSSGDVYNIAKEMLLTERTLVKDLEVLTVSFRNVLEKDKIINDELMKLLYDNLDPLYDYHCSLLAELEECLALWERGSSTEASLQNVQTIGNIMHCNMRQMKVNIQYMKRHADILFAMESSTRSSVTFEKVYKEFELGSVCYLSLSSFLLKPIQRLFYYRDMLERLTKEYGNQHPDAIDAKVAFEEVVEACKEVESFRDNLVNLNKLVELKRDLIYLDDIVHSKRKFIREGCLHKICRKGPQPRMFFLLSDILLYTSQGVTATNQFRARAPIPLRAMKLEEGGVELHSLYAFTIICPDGNSFIVAASSPAEKMKWMKDIQEAIDHAVKESFCDICEANKTEFILNIGGNNSYMCQSCKGEILKLENMHPEDRLQYWRRRYPPPVSINQLSSEADSDDEGSFSLSEQFSTLDKRHAHSRTISTRKVCWHRNVSISMKEYTLSTENSFSGNLRRRYKNTNKWQKMWVVFTNFCMYFFKNYEEDSPFASLPLIGYVVSRPSESEVHEEFAIKLQFKTHVYIFKADKEYNFKRWMEVLTIATENSSRKAQLKTRMNSRPVSSS